MPPSVRGLALGIGLALAGGCAGASDAGKPAIEHPEPARPVAEVPGKTPARAKPPPASGGSDELSALVARYAEEPPLETYRGKASYYADSLAGNSTASGEPYDPARRSAAHRKLPFGTVVRVVRSDTGAATYAVVNDRGPFGQRDRIIDLSKAAALDLDMLRAGVVPVRVEVVAHRAKGR